MRDPKFVVLNRRPDEPFIDCLTAEVPSQLVWAALLYAARICPPCKRCAPCKRNAPGMCECGEYYQNTWTIVEKYIREVRKKKFLNLKRLVLEQVSVKPIASDARALIEDARRHPAHRHPESNGFEIDSDQGPRWRRFKSLKGKGK